MWQLNMIYYHRLTFQDQQSLWGLMTSPIVAKVITKVLGGGLEGYGVS